MNCCWPSCGGKYRNMRMATDVPACLKSMHLVCSPVAGSQSRAQPVRSQEARTLLSGEKSRSNTSSFFAHLCFSGGSQSNFPASYMRTTPSVPPQATISPEGESLEMFWLGPFPSTSDVHSQSCMMVFFSTESVSTLQPAPELPSHKAPPAKVSATTTLLPVSSDAMVLIWPVCSSYRCACTTLGTSLAAFSPPPPQDTKTLPSEAMPKTGKGG
mmetsp:Transcript_93640/g.222652  ORF Transcript_93640/g.222652 Transcript_93640/m.222652 type:complete len:214 (+) Transcript_93640:383-1024(+)